MKDRINKTSKKTVSYIRKYPLLSAVVLFGVLLGVLFALNALRNPQEAPVEAETQATKVSVYTFGDDAVVTTYAEVKSSQILTLYAQTGGIAHDVKVQEGDTVTKGTQIAYLSQNYAGQSAAALQSQIAWKQYSQAKDTLEDNLEALDLQRELAEKSKENSDQMRDIAKNAVDGTRGLVDLNDSILTKLQDQLSELKSTNVAGSNDAAILSLEQAIAGQTAGVLQLRSQLLSSELQSDDRPSAKLSEISKDLTLTQLDLQEKALENGVEIARLSYLASTIADSLTRPTTPVSGTIERVFISENQIVSPGMPLVAIRQTAGNTKLVATVPAGVAGFVNMHQPSKLYVGKEVYEVYPSYLSSVATDGLLHSVVFELEDVALTSGQFVKAEIAMTTDTSTTLVPLETLFQTQETSIVYVADGTTAAAREVELGDIVGNYVEILSGLLPEDRVIISRNVVAGEVIDLE